MYRDGDGVPEDDAEAVRWFRLAADQGEAAAQYNLGVMYRDGDGVPEDIVLAYMWFNLAAAQGNENAQDNKDIAEQRMTREQIAEAQRLSTEWGEWIYYHVPTLTSAKRCTSVVSASPSPQKPRALGA